MVDSYCSNHSYFNNLINSFLWLKKMDIAWTNISQLTFRSTRAHCVLKVRVWPVTMARSSQALNGQTVCARGWVNAHIGAFLIDSNKYDNKIGLIFILKWDFAFMIRQLMKYTIPLYKMILLYCLFQVKCVLYTTQLYVKSARLLLCKLKFHGTSAIHRRKSCSDMPVLPLQ